MQVCFGVVVATWSLSGVHTDISSAALLSPFLSLPALISHAKWLRTLTAAGKVQRYTLATASGNVTGRDD